MTRGVATKKEKSTVVNVRAVVIEQGSFKEAGLIDKTKYRVPLQY